MTWVVASLLMLLAAAFVLWPLIRHWQPEPEVSSVDRAELRRRELEELELDLAARRLNPGDAAERRRELS